MKSIEDYKVGDSEEVIHTITEKDVNIFADLTGDYNPLHLDKNFAAQTNLKRPVVYGMLSASFISTLIGMKIPGEGALWTSQTLDFLQQVYVGDTLKIVGTVKHISTATNTMILNVSAINQHGQEILKGEATVQILIPMNTSFGSDKMSKICLVTGGTGDIGAAVIARLIENNYSVAFTYNQAEEKAKSLCDELGRYGKISAYKVNLSDEKQIHEMIDKVQNEFGKISSMVHCAAPRNSIKNFVDVEWQDINNQFQVQVGGFYNCVKKILPEMVTGEIAGRIVCISSIVADDVPPTAQYDYVIAKSALSSFAKSLAAEYSSKGIAVNIVAPGMTETERIAGLPQKAKLLTKMQTPSRRLILPEEIAETVIFLLNQKSCSITGETLRVCGGIKML